MFTLLPENVWVLCVIAHFLVCSTKVLCGNSKEITLYHCAVGGLTADVARDATNTVAVVVSQHPEALNKISLFCFFFFCNIQSLFLYDISGGQI